MKYLPTIFNNKKFLFAVIAVFLLVIITRTYLLGVVPTGPTWDEAAIGYNGYSIITTRRDEWLVKLPTSFRSFGDYKAPLAIYINGIFTYIFGLNLWSVRLPFALAGILFIPSFGLVVHQLARHSKYQNILVLLGMFFAATSPWHLHFSRIGFESGMALTMITLGAGMLLLGVNLLSSTSANFKKNIFSYVLIVKGVVLLLLSMYVYHSSKIFAPLLLVLLFIWAWKKVKTHVLLCIVIVLLSAGIVYPLCRDIFFGEGGTRANVLITSQGLSPAELMTEFTKNFVSHFSYRFLLFGDTDELRHGIGKWGVLSVPVVLLGIMSIILLVKKSNSNKSSLLFISAILMIVIGITPAALSTQGVPHSNRALLALPGFLLLALSALDQVLFFLKDSKLFFRIILGLIILLESLFFLDLWHYYLTQYPQKSVSSFQEGYVTAMTIARQYEKGFDNKPEVDKILFTSEYGQPYIYALFVKNPSPIAYQGGTLYKYEFSDVISSSDLERNNTLVIAGQKSGIDAEKADTVIRGKDGSVRFLIFYTGRHESEN